MALLVIGPVGCGKSTFCHALAGTGDPVRKTQAVEIVGQTIDTPGEYLENQRLYRALAVTAAGAGRIALMLSCDDSRVIFPPSFAMMFSGKPVVGIVTKTDLAANSRQIEAATHQLTMAGATAVYPVSCQTGEGIEAVRTFLQQEKGGELF